MRQAGSQPSPRHGRSSSITVPPTSTTCEPGYRSAEERGRCCREGENHGCAARLANAVACLRDDAIDAPFSVWTRQARFGGSERNQVIAVLGRHAGMTGTRQQNPACLGTGVSDVGVWGTPLCAEQTVEIESDQIFAGNGLTGARWNPQARKRLGSRPGDKRRENYSNGPDQQTKGPRRK
jgi:hypothetical protein